MKQLSLLISLLDRKRVRVINQIPSQHYPRPSSPHQDVKTNKTVISQDEARFSRKVYPKVLGSIRHERVDLGRVEVVRGT